MFRAAEKANGNNQLFIPNVSLGYHIPSSSFGFFTGPISFDIAIIATTFCLASLCVISEKIPGLAFTKGFLYPILFTECCSFSVRLF